ncbi:AAA family ATPase [bacterium]|jgi:hypothetical protein|nr:AAA family ATPase [bacterium]
MDNEPFISSAITLTSDRKNQDTDPKIVPNAMLELGTRFHTDLTGKAPLLFEDGSSELLYNLLTHIPKPITYIIHKLLAKNPSDRYLSFEGLLFDLEKCLESYQKTGTIAHFFPGQHDRPTQLTFSTTLYGRTQSKDRLKERLNTYESGPHLTLVSGEAGVGKTQLIRNTLAEHLAPNTLQGSGKFDQYSNTPLATLSQILEEVGDNLSKQSLPTNWAESLSKALDPNGRLITDLAPVFEYIIGPQPPLDIIETEDIKNRFLFVFTDFLRMLADHYPVTLFVDDLQWSDPLTLDIIKQLLNLQAPIHIIGSYRSELQTINPAFVTFLSHFQNEAPHKLTEIEIKPLTQDDIDNWLTDLLYCDDQPTDALSQLLYDKSDGNPFFLKQLLQTCIQSNTLHYDKDKQRWHWNIHTIREHQLADNVAKAMASRILTMPQQTITLMQTAACLGTRFSTRYMSIIHSMDALQVELHLWHAVAANFIHHTPNRDTYQFLHDRIQHAYTDSIPQDALTSLHNTIATQLQVAYPSPTGQVLFDIADHLILGKSHTLSEPERLYLLETLLAAGHAAQTNADYSKARRYFDEGRSHIKTIDWKKQYLTAYQLTLGHAKCLYWTSDAQIALDTIQQLEPLVKGKIKRSDLTNLKIEVLIQLNRAEEAKDLFVTYMKRLGIHPPRLMPIQMIYNIFKLNRNLNKTTTRNSPLLTLFPDNGINALYFTDKKLFGYYLITISGKYPINEKDTNSLHLLGGAAVTALHVFNLKKITKKILKKCKRIIQNNKKNRDICIYEFIVGCYCETQLKSQTDAFKTMQSAYMNGIKMGAILNSGFAIATEVINRILLGYPKSTANEVISNYESKYKLFNEISVQSTFDVAKKILDKNNLSKPLKNTKKLTLKLPLHFYLTSKALIDVTNKKYTCAKKAVFVSKKYNVEALGMIQTHIIYFIELLTQYNLLQNKSLSKSKWNIYIYKTCIRFYFWKSIYPISTYLFFYIAAIGLKNSSKKKGVMYLTMALRLAKSKNYIIYAHVISEILSELELTKKRQKQIFYKNLSKTMRLKWSS